MSAVLRWILGLSIVLAAVTWPASWASHPAKEGVQLSEIGPAPEFSLTAQDGRRVSMAGFRGKVVVVTFIYASCADTCPLLTAKMARLQARLGPEFGRNVAFVSITVDPERDTPDVLARYARAHGANPAGWAFLTGAPDEITDVELRYGVFARKTADGSVDHTFLTSIVDQRGIMRVQYLGTRFDPEEFLRDLRSLLREARSL